MSAINRRTKDKDKREERPGLCTYHAGGLYCPLPGSLSPDTSPRPTRQWYCALHIENRPQGPAAENDLREIIAAQAEIRERRKRAQGLGLLWDAAANAYTYDMSKSTIAAHAGKSIEERLQAGIDAHPEWHRQSGEASSAYRERMMAEMRRRAGSMLGRLPYDPAQREADLEATEERAAIQEAGV